MSAEEAVDFALSGLGEIRAALEASGLTLSDNSEVSPS
jgi:hypothetical protein